MGNECDRCGSRAKRLHGVRRDGGRPYSTLCTFCFEYSPPGVPPGVEGTIWKAAARIANYLEVKIDAVVRVAIDDALEDRGD